MKKIIAYTDNVTECECCGKSNLNGTFCLEIDGVEVYYGSTCTFKKHGFEKKEVTKTINAYKNKLENAQRKAGKLLIAKYGFNNWTEEIFNNTVKQIMN